MHKWNACVVLWGLPPLFSLHTENCILCEDQKLVSVRPFAPYFLLLFPQISIHTGLFSRNYPNSARFRDLYRTQQRRDNSGFESEFNPKFYLPIP